jgi:hypothetical protein
LHLLIIVSSRLALDSRAPAGAHEQSTPSAMRFQ